MEREGGVLPLVELEREYLSDLESGRISMTLGGLPMKYITYYPYTDLHGHDCCRTY